MNVKVLLPARSYPLRLPGAPRYCLPAGRALIYGSAILNYSNSRNILRLLITPIACYLSTRVLKYYQYNHHGLGT